MKVLYFIQSYQMEVCQPLILPDSASPAQLGWEIELLVIRDVGPPSAIKDRLYEWFGHVVDVGVSNRNPVRVSLPPTLPDTAYPHRPLSLA